MAGKAREQALPLLAAANNHGDLAVKLSSLRQAKDILVSSEPSVAADLFPYLVELQFSPETLVRKYLIEVIEEIGLNGLEYSSLLMPALLALLKDDNSSVAKQAVVTGTNIFCIVLEELSLQFERRGIVERWLEELWTWMVKFKGAVLRVLYEGGTNGPKLLAVKFLETYVLLFTADTSDSNKPLAEATRPGRAFNISWLVGHHPVLDPTILTVDANTTFSFMLDMLSSSSRLPGLLTISVVNSLAAIARKRPSHYNTVLSALLEFNSKFEVSKGGHTASIQYSVRTALLGFLRCTHHAIMESRERLLKALRAMNAGDAADQVIRQVEKMMRNNERALRDARSNKEEQPTNQLPVSGDLIKKRPAPTDNEDLHNNHDTASKRTRYGPNNDAAPPIGSNDSGENNVNGTLPKASLLDRELTPVEQMIAMIGALIAEGERGVESLEILISRIHPDLLADIVITNMKHLPKNPPPLANEVCNLSSNQQNDSSGPNHIVGSVSSPTSVQIPVTSAQVPVSSSLSDMYTPINHILDPKRDPRRDPRRLDPRRAAESVGVPPNCTAEDDTFPMQSPSSQPNADVANPFNQPLPVSSVFSSENMSEPTVPKSEPDTKIMENLVIPGADPPAPREKNQEEEIMEIFPEREVKEVSAIPISSVSNVEESRVEEMKMDTALLEEVYSPSLEENDELSPATLNVETSEDANVDLPLLPPYVELTEEQQRNVGKVAVERIIDSDKNLRGTECKQTRMQLLARLVTQIVDDDDADVVMMMQKHIISDYQQQKGHELVMHVLYHLQTLIVPDTVEKSSSPAAVYEKFLLGVVKDLLDTLPATDKSFSRLLGEVPWLPDSVMRLLDDICSKYRGGKDGREGDRVTQGLGAVWSLILARPLDRQACLDIALKCAIHSEDDIRAKSIRLVSNKLFVLSYISENIEQFATNMFLSAVDQHVSDTESQFGANEQRTEREVGSQETSISGSHISEPAISETECIKGAQFDSQSDSSVSFARAQSLISLFFALCTKKPSLLQLVFETYSRAPKSVKQAVHRHIPVLIRALGSSYNELLGIISDPPIGSENLLTQVLRILSEETTTPSDLIATVKRLYETKLKDATILIPVLSSFSKNEVLPIFPRLVDLPLDKFQMALAHILQGSAHSGPALTPAEVLVAIHDIRPERDGLPLKKITDACSACFEQRTVFTQQVLAKALNQMVEQTPLPLLFMRTVIQAIDAFPTLVDFVMEILSKLVSRQVWRMPKLWVGFVKCVSQTQPHSFRVLLQLPPPQLESTLNKYANLRGPLIAFASQPSVKNALPRSTLIVLGLANESHLPQQHVPSSLHAADTGSSVQGATLS